MYPLLPEAGIVTEEFRLCSLWPGAPFAMAGAPTCGTAGWMLPLPFTGEMDVDFPFCAGAEPAAATEGVLEAMAGAVVCFFDAAVALA